MQFYLQEANKWVDFYPITYTDITDRDVLDKRQFHEFSPDQPVYGKYIAGFAAGRPWYIYLEAKHSYLRAKPKELENKVCY